MKFILGVFLGYASAVQIKQQKYNWGVYDLRKAASNWPGPILPGSEPIMPIPNEVEHFPYNEILYYSQTKGIENGDEYVNLQIGVEAEARSNVRK